MIFIYLLWAGILFLLPGILLHRRWPSPLPPLTIYATSAGLWFLAWQLMNLAGVTFSREGLSGTGVILVLATAWVSRGGQPGASRPRSNGWVKPQGIEWIWLAALVCGVTSLVMRALVDPLSGWDNKFRWEGLALEWVRVGDLSGYPPQAPSDFEHYPWVDGLPPFVPGINAYLYVMLGSTAKGWTAIRVLGEMGLAGYAISSLAKTLWGPRAFWPALGIAGSSALLGWSIANGQESGQLVVAFGGAAALFAISRNQLANSATYLGAGFVVAIAAASREYGGALLMLGLLQIARLRPIDWRSLGCFVLPTALVMGPWYLRNLILTGNPLYPLSPGGLLPTVDFYTELNDSIADVWGWSGTMMEPRLIVTAVLLSAGWGIMLGVRGFPYVWRARQSWVVGWIAAVVALWVWSVPYTAGGSHYSLRVLAPALALIAAIAGWVGVHARPRVRVVCAVLTLVVAIDGACRSWFLPDAGFIPPWSLPVETWQTTAEMDATLAETSHLDELIALGAGSLIAVDKVELWVALKEKGARVVLLRSPSTRIVYEAEQNPSAIVKTLQAAGIEVILVSADQHPTFRDASKSKFLVDLIRGHQSDLHWDGVYVFKLSHLRPMEALVP